MLCYKGTACSKEKKLLHFVRYINSYQCICLFEYIPCVVVVRVLYRHYIFNKMTRLVVLRGNQCKYKINDNLRFLYIAIKATLDIILIHNDL